MAAMPGLFSIAYAELASRRFGSALTVLAVVLGTAVVFATFTTSAAVEQGTDQVAFGVLGDADLVVRSTPDQDVPREALEKVRTVPGVVVAAREVVSFGPEGSVHVLKVTLTGGTTTEDAKAELARLLPLTFVARDRDEVLADMRAAVRDFQVGLYFFGLIAMLVGAVIVFNSLSLTITRKMREFALLRVVGASTSFLVRLTLAQGLLIGVAGALLGVIAGQILAIGLVILVGRSQAVPMSVTPFSPVGVVVSLALGILVTLGASVVPALKAGRTSPLMAMHEAQSAPEAERRRRAQVAGIVAGALTVFMLLPVGGDAIRTLKGLSLFVLLPLFIYLSDVVIPALSSLAAMPLLRSAGGVGMVAERTIRRERRQTTLTVATFVFTLGAVAGLWNGASSLAADAERSTADVFAGGVLTGLIAIGLVVGSLGLANTVVMNLAQRARDMSVLRAVGMERRKVGALAVAEAAIMGTLGGMLGVIAGAFLTWVLVDLGRTASVVPRFTFSVPAAVGVVLVGMAVAVIAALYPALRTMEAGILDSLRSE